MKHHYLVCLSVFCTMRAFIVTLFCFCFCAAGYAQDTVHVYFATGESVMTRGVEDVLDGSIDKDIIRPGKKVQVIGYTDYVGGVGYNEQLSRARAARVKSYLLQTGFADKDVTICIGKGKIIRDGAQAAGGFAHDRRVDIVPVNDMVPPPVPAPAPPPADGTVIPPVRAAGKVNAAPVASTVNIATLKKNDRITLDKIYFYPGRHTIRPESRPALDALFATLKDHPKLKIKVEGHVCCIPPGAADAMDDDSGDINLSTNRARMICTYLVRKGISASRISYEGYGRRFPIITAEQNEDDADKNRRVEIRVVENE